MTGPAQQTPMALINTLGHDLRSPLTVVRGAATLLMQSIDEMTPEKVDELLRIIDRRVVQMSDRIEDILAVCHLDAGDLSVYVEPIPATVLLERALGPEERPWERAVAVADRPAEGLEVEADEERAVQVLRALVANAYRFSPSEQAVELAVREIGDRVRFEVRDRGPGVVAADQAKVFERLWHGPEGGPGLGLYMARGLAAAMDGVVGLEEREGGGSTFWFSLKRHDAGAPAEPA